MIYISIPEGMSFKKVTDDISKEIKDCFFHAVQNRYVDLQPIIKDALRTNSGRKKQIELREFGFTLYLHTPPNNDDLFLAYVPNHNGKYPTEYKPKVVSGKEAQKYNPGTLSKYGTFWYQPLTLTIKERDEIEERRIEQRENRRHEGDSPLAT